MRLWSELQLATCEQKGTPFPNAPHLSPFSRKSEPQSFNRKPGLESNREPSSVHRPPSSTVTHLKEPVHVYHWSFEGLVGDEMPLLVRHMAAPQVSRQLATGPAQPQGREENPCPVPTRQRAKIPGEGARDDRLHCPLASAFRFCLSLVCSHWSVRRRGRPCLSSGPARAWQGASAQSLLSVACVSAVCVCHGAHMCDRRWCPCVSSLAVGVLLATFQARPNCRHDAPSVRRHRLARMF